MDTAACCVSAEINSRIFIALESLRRAASARDTGERVSLGDLNLLCARAARCFDVNGVLAAIPKGDTVTVEHNDNQQSGDRGCAGLYLLHSLLYGMRMRSYLFCVG